MLNANDKTSNSEKKHQTILKCDVVNCSTPLEEGAYIKLGERIYCRKCGTQIVKQSFLGV